MDFTVTNTSDVPKTFTWYAPFQDDSSSQMAQTAESFLGQAGETDFVVQPGETHTCHGAFLADQYGLSHEATLFVTLAEKDSGEMQTRKLMLWPIDFLPDSGTPLMTGEIPDANGARALTWTLCKAWKLGDTRAVLLDVTSSSEAALTAYFTEGTTPLASLMKNGGAETDSWGASMPEGESSHYQLYLTCTGVTEGEPVPLYFRMQSKDKLSPAFVAIQDSLFTAVE